MQHVDDDELARTVEAAVLAETPGRTSSQLRRRVRDLLVKIDPQAAARRREAAEKGRRVELYDNPSGTCDLVGRDLPAEQAHGIFNKLRAVAQALKADGDPRPVDAIRADLLLALCDGKPWPQAAHQVAENLDDRAGDPSAGDRFCDESRSDSAHARGNVNAEVLEGLEPEIGQLLAGAIDDQLRRLRDHARHLGRRDGLRQLTTDALTALTTALAPVRGRWCVATGNASPDGHGTGHYRPPPAMRRLVERRHPVCGFPSCNRRAGNCDLDHTIPFHQGGATCPCNLSPLCRRHHRLKQHQDWVLVQPWPGILIWITPAGKWHIVMAE